MRASNNLRRLLVLIATVVTNSQSQILSGEINLDNSPNAEHSSGKHVASDFVRMGHSDEDLAPPPPPGASTANDQDAIQQPHSKPKHYNVIFDTNDRKYEFSSTKAMSIGYFEQRLNFDTFNLQQIGNGGKLPEIVPVRIEWIHGAPSRGRCASSLMLRIRTGFYFPESFSLQFEENGVMVPGIKIPAWLQRFTVNIPIGPINEAYHSEKNHNHPFWLTVVSAECKKIYGFSEPFYLKNYEWQTHDLTTRNFDGFRIDAEAFDYHYSKLLFNLHNLVSLRGTDPRRTHANVGITWNLPQERRTMLRCSHMLELIVKQGQTWKQSVTVQWTHLPKMYSHYSVPIPLGTLKNALRSNQNLPNNFYLAVICTRDKKILAVSPHFSVQDGNEGSG